MLYPILPCEQLQPSSSWSLFRYCVIESNITLKFLLLVCFSCCFVPDIQYPFSMFLMSHSFMFHSGVADTPFQVLFMWHKTYMLTLNEIFLGSLQFTLPAGRNDRGDGNVILQCLDFKTPNLKTAWNVSYSRQRWGSEKQFVFSVSICSSTQAEVSYLTQWPWVTYEILLTTSALCQISLYFYTTSGCPC